MTYRIDIIEGRNAGSFLEFTPKAGSVREGRLELRGTDSFRAAVESALDGDHNPTDQLLGTLPKVLDRSDWLHVVAALSEAPRIAEDPEMRFEIAAAPGLAELGFETSKPEDAIE